MRTCGGFFDVPKSQQRLDELSARMAADNFWDNREQAQKVIGEANSLRDRIEPLTQAEKQLDDLKVMLELAEAEPPEAQASLEQELRTDTEAFVRQLDDLELKFFLSDPNDRNNCIFNVNAGAGGTEAQDWAEMLARMYQRWFETELGLPWENRELWERLSPWNRADRITTPTMWVGGEKDWNVPILGSEHMYIAAKRHGLEALLVVYPGEDHSVDQPKHVQDLYDRYLAWFDRWLKGEKSD